VSGFSILWFLFFGLPALLVTLLLVGLVTWIVKNIVQIFRGK